MRNAIAGFLLSIVIVIALAAADGRAQTAAPPQAPSTEAAAPQAQLQALPIASPPQAPAPASELVTNPYGFSALWNGGDMVARGTLIVLLIMSLGSWYVIITKLADQMMLSHQARSAEAKFWRAPSVAEGAATLGRRNAFRLIVEDGVRAAEHREGTLAEQIDSQSWITLTLQHAADALGNRLQRGLAFLATVGSTAPFVGLFGTVWGIYHALTEIGIAGQASIDKVAGPVGEALIMTTMGLAVAVPAVLGYNWLVRRNKVLLDRVRGFTADLLALLTSAGAPSSARAAVRSA
jgi:biopolymer transport protein ExbB